MFIAVYRDKETNKISNVNEVENLSASEISEAAELYNKDQKNRGTVEVQRLDDNGLEAFLLNRYMLREKENRENLTNISLALHELLAEMP